MGDLLDSLLVIVPIFLLIVWALTAWQRRGMSNYTLGFDDYRRKRQVLTEAERSFISVVRLAVGADYSIQVKVRLEDLIEVREICRRRQAKLNAIAGTHLDCVLFEPTTMQPVLGFTLHDRLNDSTAMRKRTAFLTELLASVGMPLLLLETGREYRSPKVKAMVENTVGDRTAGLMQFNRSRMGMLAAN